MTPYANDEHAIHQFEDDGGQPAKEPVVLKDTRVPRTRYRDQRIQKDPEEGETLFGLPPRPPAEPPKLIITGGQPNPSEPPKIVGPTGEPVSSLTWEKYCEWRRTKCRPCDHVNGPPLAIKPGSEFAEATLEEMVARPSRERALEEIDQATLEFVGEVGVLIELVMDAGPYSFVELSPTTKLKVQDDPRKRLIDEAGDALFCGAWVLDAWGNNPLLGSDDLELIRVADENPLAMLARVIAENGAEAFRNPQVLGVTQNTVMNFLCRMGSLAGLLCNSFKKLRYHRKEQNVEEQVARVATILFNVNQLLILANSSVEEALHGNMRKINERRPNGYEVPK